MHPCKNQIKQKKTFYFIKIRHTYISQYILSNKMFHGKGSDKSWPIKRLKPTVFKAPQTQCLHDLAKSNNWGKRKYLIKNTFQFIRDVLTQYVHNSRGRALKIFCMFDTGVLYCHMLLLMLDAEGPITCTNTNGIYPEDIWHKAWDIFHKPCIMSCSMTTYSNE